MKTFVFLTLIYFAASLTCSRDGYMEYLTFYPFKATDDNVDEYIESHLGAYVLNCNRLQFRQSIEQDADVTVFMDWTDEELQHLGDLVIKFSGNKSYFSPVETLKSSFSLTRAPYSFSDAFVSSYSSTSTICSTSWVTSIIEVAEAAVDHAFQFSPDQLLQCLPDYFGMDSGCSGVNERWLISYLHDVGLVKKTDFVSCDTINNMVTYKFNAVFPEVPNKSGLMNLVAEENPVFVMAALDLLQLRFVKDMNTNNEPLNIGNYQPTMYGIVSGYDSTGTDPYWEITTHLLPAEEITFRIPMSEDERDANYGGIAAYAFTLELQE